MSRYSFSLLCLLLVSFGWSQKVNQQGDTIPKVKIDWTPHELKVGTNLIRAGRSAFGSDLVTYELQAGLAMHQATFIVDIGIEENQRGESFNYTNEGSYYRVGADWNFVKDLPSGNVLSLGLRHGRASFKDQLEFTQNYGFGEENFRYANDKLRARWYEVTFNLRGKVVSNLYMGFTMRWQFARNINGESELLTFDVPGFGKTRRENSTAFDYYVMWRLPFSKKQGL